MQRLLAWQVHEVISFIVENNYGQYVPFIKERNIEEIIKSANILMFTTDYYFTEGKE